MIESLGACAGADKKPMESLHTSHVLRSQDRRGVGVCSTNRSDGTQPVSQTFLSLFAAS